MSISVCLSVCLYMSVCVYSLTTEGKKLLMQYGSSLVGKLQFRDNFVMIGQKGLAKGSAIEQVLAAVLNVMTGACYDRDL